jgi:multidrug transporter EmrE-like cation transporter
MKRREFMGFVGNTSLCLLASQFPLMSQFKSKSAAQEFVFVEAEQFANHGGMFPFVTGIGGYVGVIYFLIRSLQGSTVLLVNSAWDGISTLIEGLIGIIVYGEYFTSVSQYVGFIFLIIGLFLLKIPLKRKHKFVFPSFGLQKRITSNT